jgi:hypothetical protein
MKSLRRDVRRSVLPAFCLLAALHIVPGSARASWERIEAGGDTSCGPGSPYDFFVHRGSPDRLLVFLQGGGACWSALLCDTQHGAATYDPGVDAADIAETSAGILDLENPANPFRGATVLFVPYCTGDVHLGDRVRTYQWMAEDGTVTRFDVRHFGRRNAMAALRWIFRALPAVQRAFVAGHSAGGVASPIYAAVVAENYPQALVAQLADGSTALRAAAVPDFMDLWAATQVVRHRPEDRSGEQLQFAQLYGATARVTPRVTLAQLSRRDDAVQEAFVALAGRALAARTLLAEGVAATRRVAPGLKSYVADGDTHATLATDEFYTLRSGGVLLRDWVAALASGEPVADVAPGDG